MLTPIWRVAEDVVVWLVPALLGAIVVLLLVTGSRRITGRQGRGGSAMPDGPELLLGSLCFGVIWAIGHKVEGLGAPLWMAGLACVLAGALAMPLLAAAHSLVMRIVRAASVEQE